MPDTDAPRPDADLATLLGSAPLRPDAVPEFLWYDLAIEALGPDAPAAARLAALRVLARTPRAWDAVMMVALTTSDLGVQLATLDALKAHAAVDSERLEAFGRLGELPAWHSEARRTWEAYWRELAEAYEAARRERMWRELNARVAKLAVENADLLETGRAMQAELSSARQAEDEAIERAESLEACLGGETERLEALLVEETLRVTAVIEAERLARETAVAEEMARAHAMIASQVGRLEVDLENERMARAGERSVLVQARVEAETGVKRWRMVAGIGLFTAVGPLLALASGNSPVMATSPKERPAISAKAAMPGSDEGYRAAVDALSTKAARLEAEGKLAEARTAWQCVSAVALTADEIRAAGQRAEALRSKSGGSKPGAKITSTKVVDPEPTSVQAAWPVKPVSAPTKPDQGPNSRMALAAAGRAALARQKGTDPTAAQSLGAPIRGRAAARKAPQPPRLPAISGYTRPLSSELTNAPSLPPAPPAAEAPQLPGDDAAPTTDPIPASVRAKF